MQNMDNTKFQRYYGGIGPNECSGQWLAIDGYGYHVKRCEKELIVGESYYYKQGCKCEQSEKDKLYCSFECCYPYKCGNCGKRSCKECYIAKANDQCTYCMYLSEECECPAFDSEGRPTSFHDRDFCSL